LTGLTFTGVSVAMLLVLAAEEPGAAPFSLESQFGKSESVEFPRDKVTLLTIADRKGSAQLTDWVKPVADRYLGRVDIVAVATVGSVPKSLRGLVRSMFRKQSAYPILLDWEGPVSHQYSARRGLANLFLIDRNGTIQSRHHGPASGAAVQQLLADIERLLEQPRP
jgi:hypothetical protein